MSVLLPILKLTRLAFVLTRAQTFVLTFHSFGPHETNCFCGEHCSVCHPQLIKQKWTEDNTNSLPQWLKMTKSPSTSPQLDLLHPAHIKYSYSYITHLSQQQQRCWCILLTQVVLVSYTHYPPNVVFVLFDCLVFLSLSLFIGSHIQVRIPKVV